MGEIELSANTQSGLPENVAALLSYVLGWITGLVFLLIDKRPYVKFHAAQSIVVFLGLHLLRGVLGLIFGMGWWFGGAGYGREAVQKTTQLIPNLIILDLAMPVMNGLLAAREISQLLPSVPIVLFSMYATPQVELEAKKVGIRAVVPKSEAPRVLLPTIETVLAEASPY